MTSTRCERGRTARDVRRLSKYLDVDVTMMAATLEYQAKKKKINVLPPSISSLVGAEHFIRHGDLQVKLALAPLTTRNWDIFWMGGFGRIWPMGGSLVGRYSQAQVQIVRSALVIMAVRACARVFNSLTHGAQSMCRNGARKPSTV